MQFQEEYGQQIIPPHTPYHLTPEQYEDMRIFRPDVWMRTMYCPRTETAYELDPESDPRDLELIRNSQRRQPHDIPSSYSIPQTYRIHLR